jgi:hypothetical protein
VRAVVEQQRGHLGFDNNNPGFRVRLELPRRKDDSPQG